MWNAARLFVLLALMHTAISALSYTQLQQQHVLHGISKQTEGLEHGVPKNAADLLLSKLSGSPVAVFAAEKAKAQTATQGEAPHPELSFLGKRKDDGTPDTRHIELATFAKLAQHLRGRRQSNVSLAEVQLTFTPTRLTKNNDTFTLSWSGVTKPTPDDWIGVYSPATSDDFDYLDFFFASQSPTYMTGAGSYSFPLLNMRTNYQFRYFSMGYIRAGVSDALEVDQLAMGGTLALTGDNTQMRVGWITNSNATAPTVRFGLTPTSLDRVATGTSHTYSATDMCGPRASVVGAMLFRDPGFIHDVLLTDLRPSTVYYYDYGAGVKRFRTAPPVGSDQPASMIIFGDMGADYVPDGADGRGSVAVMMRLLDTTDLVLHIGDLSYARGRAFVWEKFSNLIEPIATRVPYMVGVGNHEYNHYGDGSKDPSGTPGDGWHPSWGDFLDDSHGECGRPLAERYHMPDNGLGVFWYSFDYGSVHVIHMSTEHDYSPNSPQYIWLENNLKSVNRAVTPWIVLAGHRPMYTSADYDADYIVSEHMQMLFEHLLFRYQVDIAIWGHYHSYERTCTVFNQTCQAPDSGVGTVHIIIGTAGADLDTGGWKSKDWSAARLLVFGLGRLTVTPDMVNHRTTLRWEFIQNSDLRTLDEVTITKSLP